MKKIIQKVSASGSIDERNKQTLERLAANYQRALESGDPLPFKVIRVRKAVERESVPRSAEMSSDAGTANPQAVGGKKPIARTQTPRIPLAKNHSVVDKPGTTQPSHGSKKASETEGTTNPPQSPHPEQLLRLSQIVGKDGILPISKATFYDLVKLGVLPKPIKLSARISCWRKSDIIDFIKASERGGSGHDNL